MVRNIARRNMLNRDFTLFDHDGVVIDPSLYEHKSLKVVGSGGNRKLGLGVATTYRVVGDSCPQDCKMLVKGCYAKRGYVGYHQKNSLNNHHSLNNAEDARYIRHHVSGDVFIDDRLDVEYVQMIIDWHNDNPQITGWMYTHRIQAWVDAGFTSDTIPSGLEIIASVDTEDERLYAVKHGFKYARIEIDPDKALPSNEVLCPFDKKKDKGSKTDDIKITCKSCKMCFAPEHSGKHIVFMFQKTRNQKTVDLTIGKTKGAA